MIAHLSALSAEHDEIVEVPSSPRRKEGLPPGHRGDQGEQPLHPRGGGGTPSPLVGWAGGRWPVGAQSSFCTFSPGLLQLQKPDLTCTATSSSSLCRSSLGPAAATAAERRYIMALGPAAAIAPLGEAEKRTRCATANTHDRPRFGEASPTSAAGSWQTGRLSDSAKLPRS